MKLKQVRTIEIELADRRPFGNAHHINKLVDRVYLHRLSLTEGKLPAALDLKQSLCRWSKSQRHHFLRDTMLRIGIDQAMLYASGLPTRLSFDVIVSLLGRAASLSRRSCQTTVLDSLQPLSARLDRGSSSPLIWTPNADLISQIMEEIVHEMVPDAYIDFASREQIKTLKAAMTLMETLVPQLTPSALNHVTSIVIVSESETPGLGHRGFGSGTNRGLPGVIVVSASELKTPWRAAEILLHEALHLKFIDLEFTHSMNLNPSKEDESWTIMPPWRKPDVNSDEWLPIRAMTAAHVYIGMSLFFHSGQLLAAHPNALASYQPAEFQKAIQEAPYRAQFLLETLSERIENLGLAGQYFVQWLQELAESLSNTTVRLGRTNDRRLLGRQPRIG